MSLRPPAFPVIRRAISVSAFGVMLCLVGLSSFAFSAEIAELPKATPEGPGEVIVACPAEFEQALAPWIAHRRSQSYVVTLVNNTGTADQVRARMHGAFASENSDKFLLLVGDAPAQDGIGQTEFETATFFVPAKVNKHLGGGNDIATDNPFADIDRDGIPDAAVGRLPADSAEELGYLVEKILNYEREAPGTWQRQINFIAGVGGFGMLADRAIEMGARRFITEGIPAAFRTSMTYASWQSPYYPGGSQFRQATLDRFNEGSLFCVYIGHGNRTSLDYVRETTPFGSPRAYPILTRDDVDKIACETGAPIALFLACHTGSFDGDRDSLAEDLLRRKGGPVAAVCGSRVTMPYAMSVLGNELIRQCFVERRATLGQLLQYAKRATIENSREDETSQLLDNVASLLNIQSDLEAERVEHLSLFNLIGDPLLQVSMPETWDMQIPAKVKAGDRIEINVTPTFAANVQFELIVKRGELTFEAPLRTQLRGSKRELEELWDTYTRANEQTLAAAKTEVRPGKQYRVKLQIPEDATGDCHIRMFATGIKKSAVGSVDVTIKSP